MRMKVLRDWGVTALRAVVVLAAVVALAVPHGMAAPPPAAAKTPIKVRTSRTVIKGDRYEMDKPIITYKDTTVTADKGVVVGKGDKQTGTFTGQVKVSQPSVRLSCSALEVRFKDDRAIASGGVSLVREETRKDESGKPSLVRTTVACDKAEFLTAGQDFTVTGNVYIEDKDVKVWAAKGVYTDKDKKLVLSGKVRVQRSSDGSKINADTVTYFTQTENLEVSGSAEIFTFVD